MLSPMEKLSKASHISSCKLQFNLKSQEKVIFRAWNFVTESTSAKQNLLALHTLKQQSIKENIRNIILTFL
jgi:hypothetical protein